MPTDTIAASLHSNGLLCIRNQRFDRDGHDLGGVLFIAPECAGWLAGAIRGFLSDRRPRRQKIGPDDMEVKFSGPDYHPRLAIYSRRASEATEGGVRVQSMQLGLGRVLSSQLDSIASNEEGSLASEDEEPVASEDETSAAALDWLYARRCPQCDERAGWSGRTEELWGEIALVMRCPSCRNEFNWVSGALQGDLRTRPPAFNPGRGA